MAPGWQTEELAEEWIEEDKSEGELGDYLSLRLTLQVLEGIG